MIVSVLLAVFASAKVNVAKRNKSNFFTEDVLKISIAES